MAFLMVYIELYRRLNEFVEMFGAQCSRRQLKLSATIGASFIFQSKAAQDSDGEAKNCAANAQTCKIILENANATSWTSVDYNYLGRHCNS